MPTPFLQIPNAVWASAGAAEGDTELNAFDNALLAARVGNLNLIRVSSVLPQDATVLEDAPQITPGSLVPTVYSVHVSARPGDTVANAAVEIALAEVRQDHALDDAPAHRVGELVLEAVPHFDAHRPCARYHDQDRAVVQ